MKARQIHYCQIERLTNIKYCFLRKGAHDHHYITVVCTELRPWKLHTEGQPGIVNVELRGEGYSVIFIRRVDHPNL